MDIDKHLAVLTQGLVLPADLEEIKHKLRTKHSLRIKAGFDPTHPDLHLGHTVLLHRMRQLQQLGHQIIFLIGDFTARIGDSTERNTSRPPLTKEQVDQAAQTYQQQVFKILDPQLTEVRYNSEWMDRLSAQDMTELCSKYTISRLLERNDFKARLAKGMPIAVHELLYPLFQGFDSVMVEADIELGGDDQMFNLLVGRDLMPRYGKEPQCLVTYPLLLGANEYFNKNTVKQQKMSKSLGNSIAITAPPHEMFQQLMLLDDTLISHYIRLLSDLTAEQQEELRHQVEQGTLSIVTVKENFATEIVTRFHSQAAVEQVKMDRRAILEDKFPSWTPKLILPAQPILLSKVLYLAKMADSISEGSRLITNSSVVVNDEKIYDRNFMLQPSQRYLIRVGRKDRKFVDLTLEG